MKILFFIFLLLKIYNFANAICSDQSTKNKCILQNVTLTEDFLFDLTEFDNKF